MEFQWLMVDRWVDHAYVIGTAVGTLVMVAWMVDWMMRKRRSRG
jgi:hypothetical protein